MQSLSTVWQFRAFLAFGFCLDLCLLLSYGAFSLHGTVQYGSLLGGFPLGTVPGTWYFFSTTSAEVPIDVYRYQNVTCKLY